MTAYNIEFSGAPARISSVKRLIEFYCQKKGIKSLSDSTLLVLDTEVNKPLECKAAALPYDLCTDEFRLIAVKASVRTVTYSLENFSADFVALNKQARESSVSFELMASSSMARIFIADDKGFTIDDVLPAAAALYAGGEALGEIVETFNCLLK